jgi:hypothetical protein
MLDNMNAGMGIVPAKNCNTTVETIAGFESPDIWLEPMMSYRDAVSTQALSKSACILIDEFNLLKFSGHYMYHLL